MSADSSERLKHRLYETVLLLASEHGRIEERLGRAYHAHIRDLEAALFPAALRHQYETLRAELKELYPEPGKADGVEQNRAVDLAQRIILIYDAMIK